MAYFKPRLMAKVQNAERSRLELVAAGVAAAADSARRRSPRQTGGGCNLTMQFIKQLPHQFYSSSAMAGSMSNPHHPLSAKKIGGRMSD